jgi:hypothetical protein
MNTQFNSEDFNIKELHVYNSEAIPISCTCFVPNENDKVEAPFVMAGNPSNYKFYKVVRDFVKGKAEDKLTNNFESIDYIIIEKSSSFDKICVNNCKVFLLTKTDLTFVGIFENKTKGYLIKLFMLHYYSAFVNFIGNTLYTLSSKEDVEERTLNYLTKDFFQVKLFEVILLLI